MKTAVVTPLFKKGDRLEAKNYRPISNLTVFSKILENCFLLRLVHFFSEQKLIPDCQHGFVPGKCTLSALFEFFARLYALLEEKEKPLGVFLRFN
jgi:Reverse transcriptase (RNA-dependent DNA polymerase)